MKRDLREAAKTSHLSHADGTSSPLPGAELEETIRQRAYELYERRGRTAGSELDDWVQAESEILNSHETSKAA